MDESTRNGPCPEGTFKGAADGHHALFTARGTDTPDPPREARGGAPRARRISTPGAVETVAATIHQEEPLKHPFIYRKDDINLQLLTRMLAKENLGGRGSKSLRCGCIEAEQEWLMCQYHAGVQYGLVIAGSNKTL